MPFDTTIVSVLDRIGLIPVPDEVLQAHKQQMVNWFAKMSHTFPEQARSHTRWFEYYTATGDIGKKMITNYTQGPVKDVFGALLSLSGQASGVSSNGVPQAVINITAETERRMREVGIETERVLGVFYTDPYICLLYREDDAIKRACLAIWDDQTVLHIAALTRSPFLE